jgi:hypothetical protein
MVFIETKFRKYEWIEYEDGTVLGHKSDCQGNSICSSLPQTERKHILGFLMKQYFICLLFSKCSSIHRGTRRQKRRAS